MTTYTIRFTDRPGIVRLVDAPKPPTSAMNEGVTYLVWTDPERGGNNLIARRIK